MRCLKRLGQRVISRDFDHQDAELQIRATILNRFTALGAPLTQRARYVCPGKGTVQSSTGCHDKAPRTDVVRSFQREGAIDRPVGALLPSSVCLP